MIPFNKPCITGKEIEFIQDAVKTGQISGNGKYTKLCQKYFEDCYGFQKALLTTSCTDALEMCAILADIKPGDEVIIPSYTFVSSALAFVREGAKIVFADSKREHPNINEHGLEQLITKRTKVIVVVHYAGVACNMDFVMEVAEKHNLLVIEDAAQAIESYFIGKNYHKRALGSIGHMGALSFHETKNINSGEGGLITINDDKFIRRSEIVWEKGTNRAEFFRGEVSKYGWIDIGSSFLPSELCAAYLWAQLENLEAIQKRRIQLWNKYYLELKLWCEEKSIDLPFIPDYSTNNGHIFYLIFKDAQQKQKVMQKLKDHNVIAATHYLSLHSSQYYKEKYTGPPLVNADSFSERLLRLPLYNELTEEQVEMISCLIRECDV